MRLSRTRPVHAVSVTLMIADGFTGSMSKSQNTRIHGRGIRIFRHVGGRIGDDWYTDYGNKTRIRDSLSIAVNTYNSGMMDEDWDEPNVYQRRRRWYC